MPRETHGILPAVIAEAAPGTPGRFGFGANWAAYLRDIDLPRIDAATDALAALLDRTSLHGVRVLDIGSGSGIHSLAAFRLGAHVTSFDFDAESVACTSALCERYGRDATSRWTVVGQGSILDPVFVHGLGEFGLVYSWGVLHHTGDLRRAVLAAASRVSSGGQLVLALYNDQGWISSYWTHVKRLYNANVLGRIAMTAIHLPYLAARCMVRFVTRKGALERGMSLWHDYVDWLGGFPFEVASIPEVTAWLAPRGFVLQTVRSVGRRQGCNEFVFMRAHAS